MNSNNKIYFDKHRTQNEFLMYLTIFNDIISQYNFISRDELIVRAGSCPYICQMQLDPYVALDKLINIGALIII